MAQQNGNFADLYRFDSAGNYDYNQVTSSNSFPGVYTFIQSPTGFVQRLNGAPFLPDQAANDLGQPVPPNPFTSGSCDPQDLIGIGGQTDEAAAVNPNYDFCGNIGITLLFPGALSPECLAYWEGYVMALTGSPLTTSVPLAPFIPSPQRRV